MKVIATTDARYVKAAMVCQGKQDIRYYLNGVHLSKSGEVQSSDGSTGFYVKDDRLKEMSDSIIVSIFSAIPPKAVKAEFLYDDNENIGVIRFTDKHYSVMEKTVGFRIVDGPFPDLERIKVSDGVKAESVGFNAMYLARLESIAKALGIKYQAVLMKPCGAHNTAFFEMKMDDGEVATCVIMPMRM